MELIAEMSSTFYLPMVVLLFSVGQAIDWNSNLGSNWLFVNQYESKLAV